MHQQGKHEVQTRGIVVSRFSSGEGNTRVHIFTEDLGLISVFARSAREERSKLRPHLTVGTFGHFDLVRGVGGWRVVGAVETKNAYFACIGNAAAQTAAARFLSLIRQLIQGEERDAELFVGMWGFFSALSSLQGTLLVHLERFATLQMLSKLGYVSPSAVPGAISFDYSLESIQSLVPLERQIADAIKEGFVASGLL